MECVNLNDLNRTWAKCASSPFSQENINGVYVPSFLLVTGIAIVKMEWVPYAVALVALIGGLKLYFSAGMFEDHALLNSSEADPSSVSEMLDT